MKQSCIVVKATQGVTQEQIERFVYGWVKGRGADSKTAWKRVYELLMWCEDVGGQSVPHIVEANLLKKKTWLDRAIKVRDVLSRALATDPCDKVDNLMKGLVSVGKQRHNYLGRGFSATLKALLEIVAGVSSRKEVPLRQIPNLAGISSRKRVDLVVPDPSNLRVIISCKWSLRHDRIKDLLDEARGYKSRMPSVKFFVVTNEFTNSRLNMIVGDPNIDAVYHVCKPLLQKAGLSPPHALKDLQELFVDVKDP